MIAGNCTFNGVSSPVVGRDNRHKLEKEEFNGGDAKQDEADLHCPRGNAGLPFELGSVRFGYCSKHCVLLLGKLFLNIFSEIPEYG
ncbi:MAG: hypothetical protein WA664_10905 [Candidatus Acidiferrales bacterium]